MNEFVNLNDSQYAAPPALTDEQLEKLLETKPDGEIIISTDDADEAEEDKVLN